MYRMADSAASAIRPPRLLLTGRPGCGKTTVIRRAVERIGAGRCAGFYTEEVREGGRRVGFDVVTLDGRRGPLARAGAPGPRVGRYGVDVRSFEDLGVGTLADALGRRAAVIVVDEIGKMELLSDRFVELLEPIFGRDSDRVVLGTVLQGRHPVVDRLRRRSDVQVIAVTAANRGELPGRLSAACLDFLERRQGAGGPARRRQNS
jgi:nucleoside-triphosphatase